MLCSWRVLHATERNLSSADAWIKISLKRFASTFGVICNWWSTRTAGGTYGVAQGKTRWRWSLASVQLLEMYAMFAAELSVLMILVGIRALRNYPKKIKSFNEARSITGVGEKTARKVCIHWRTLTLHSHNTCFARSWKSSKPVIWDALATKKRMTSKPLTYFRGYMESVWKVSALRLSPSDPLAQADK